MHSPCTADALLALHGTWLLHRNMLLFHDTFSSTPLLSYILFWMVFYNLCHVF